jgi:hypothetical protein
MKKKIAVELSEKKKDQKKEGETFSLKLTIIIQHHRTTTTKTSQFKEECCC